MTPPKLNVQPSTYAKAWWASWSLAGAALFGLAGAILLQPEFHWFVALVVLFFGSLLMAWRVQEMYTEHRIDAQPAPDPSEDLFPS